MGMEMEKKKRNRNCCNKKDKPPCLKTKKRRPPGRLFSKYQTDFIRKQQTHHSQSAYSDHQHHSEDETLNWRHPQELTI
jgi:hypothetical protein